MGTERVLLSSSTLGTIHIKNIEFQGYHGAYPEERKILRRFQIDAVISFDMTSAMQSDHLADTIDYFKICDVIFRIGTETTFHLLEGLAGALLKEILRRWPHVGIEIEVRKLYPPCPGNPDFISVRAEHLRK